MSDLTGKLYHECPKPTKARYSLSPCQIHGCKEKARHYQFEKLVCDGCYQGCAGAVAEETPYERRVRLWGHSN